MPQHPRSLQPYSYASNSPTVCVDPLGLYSCLTGERWPLDLIPLCLLLDSSPEARYLFYEHVIVAGMGAIGWNDAAIFLGHYLDATGETMYFGSGLVRLIERDAAHVIDNKRMEYLSGAARGMGGRAGILPWLSDDQTVFMSNTEGIPTWYASEVYPLSQEVWIALGGFWFDRSYGGKVEEKVQGTYHISLWTVFSVDKRWSFAPNVEMGMTENPPAEFNIADRIGIPGWLPRPYLLPPIFPFPIIIPDNAWTLYIPDEWGQALEDDGYAASFWAKGTWARYEQFLAVDHNCDGWDVDDILGEPMIVSEILPTGVDPAPSMSYEQFSRFD